jgi:RNA polymerase sigma factor (sigma-70 family)
MSRHPRLTAVAEERGEGFEQVVLPHLDAAYRLARWHAGDPHDAEDIVQEASLRALRYFSSYAGGNARAWFLRIVRNASADWLDRHNRRAIDLFDEQAHSAAAMPGRDPETSLLDADVATSVAQTLRLLPERFRQVLVLREIEGLSYRELARVMNVPTGTVMSRLSRARQAFRAAVDVRARSSRMAARGL